jgi:hypothetical protein
MCYGLLLANDRCTLLRLLLLCSSTYTEKSLNGLADRQHFEHVCRYFVASELHTGGTKNRYASLTEWTLCRIDSSQHGLFENIRIVMLLGDARIVAGVLMNDWTCTGCSSVPMLYVPYHCPSPRLPRHSVRHSVGCTQVSANRSTVLCLWILAVVLVPPVQSRIQDCHDD